VCKMLKNNVLVLVDKYDNFSDYFSLFSGMLNCIRISLTIAVRYFEFYSRLAGMCLYRTSPSFATTVRFVGIYVNKVF